jgi:AcrR family transcriptional regulator
MTSRANSRTKILESARRLLEYRGHEALTVEETAREAGVSRQAVYLHFKSRTGLLLALVQHIEEDARIPELVAGLGRAKDAAGSLRIAASAHVMIAPRIHSAVAALESAALVDDDAAAALRLGNANRRRSMLRLSRRLADEGVLAAPWDVRSAADFLWALTAATTYRQLVVDRGWSIRRYRERFETIMVRTLLVPSAW